jgi:hypothetical protein
MVKRFMLGENSPAREAIMPSRLVMSWTEYSINMAPIGRRQATKTVRVRVNATMAVFEYVFVNRYRCLRRAKHY